MTTKVTTVQETLRTTFATLLSSKVEIPDTIDIAANDDNVLDEGWGLRIGEVVNAELQTFCQDRTLHNYTLIVTKWIPRLDHDADLFHTKLNELSEDARTIRSKLTEDAQLGIDSSVDIINHSITTAPGKIEAERGTILFIEINFEIEISESR